MSVILISGCIDNYVQKEPTILEFGKPAIINDVSVTFDSVRFADKIDDYTKADNGYKFAIIHVTAKNLGLEETQFPFSSTGSSYMMNIVLSVNKGYKYKVFNSDYFFSIRPEDTETVDFEFEILKDTYPTELYLERVKDTTDCLKAQRLWVSSLSIYPAENIEGLKPECIDKYTVSIQSTFTKG
ncbi:MAG: DUF4352 domain-containing protein [Nanoarchaeota archaeon]|nr:DUF4352 domain-containing protein [Nanoarchaeota archaeon]MBU4451492.1 DUF4352 domain-containing protein [Nanoarchaeota archaeon]MCG2723857.1 DUF4352 domain-containing protein [archaeon]